MNIQLRHLDVDVSVAVGPFCRTAFRLEGDGGGGVVRLHRNGQAVRRRKFTGAAAVDIVVILGGVDQVDQQLAAVSAKSSSFQAGATSP